MAVNFRVELIWKESDDKDASSIFLTSDGRVILQGRSLSAEERDKLRCRATPTSSASTAT